MYELCNRVSLSMYLFSRISVIIIAAKVKRHYNPPNTMTRFDNQLLIFDAFERMSGYSYFGIIDFDEFLIPSKNRSLKELLVRLYHHENMPI